MTDPRFNDPLTRRQLLRRAAVGGTALTLPGLLAACGGGAFPFCGRAGESVVMLSPSSLSAP